jgi:hypothetical protein
MEEFDTVRCPSLPGKLPGITEQGSMEGGSVAETSRVGSIAGPLPHHGVGLVRKLDVLKSPPEQQIFANLLDAQGAMYVPDPAAVLQALSDSSGAPPVLGDAGV